MTLGTNGVNAAQIEHWNGPAGETWVRLQARLDAQLAALGRLAMDRAAIRPGEAVLDVGCGTGETTLELSRRVGEGGKVLGVDVSRAMLSLARRRLEASGFSQTRFEEGDAQTHDFARGGFDLVFSRFGIMFFADPVAAFKKSARRSRETRPTGFRLLAARSRKPLGGSADGGRLPAHSAAPTAPARRTRRIRLRRP